MSLAYDLDIIKCDVDGTEVWRYAGRILKRNSQAVLIEAYFNRDDLPFHGVLLRRDDRFVEVYFSNRWFNIFEIHDKDDDRLKAWYCNVTRPALFEDDRISYIDLALDLLVFPDGRQLVLDEDEFALLPLDDETRKKAHCALQELQSLFDSSVGQLEIESLLDSE